MNPRPFGDELAQAVRKYLHDNQITQRHLTGEMLADIGQRFYDHFQDRQKVRKKRGEASPEEIAIYEAYPRKVGREDAIHAIRSAIQKSGDCDILAATRRYAACVAKWSSSYRHHDGRDTVPYPATWFNSGRYLDDPKEWLPAGMFSRPDDRPELANGSGDTGQLQSLREPAGWSEAVKGHEDLGVFEGRLWESINPYYQKQIIKLCSP